MNGPASIAEVIAAEGGEVTFARFMELALTHPTLGYYSRADRLLGYRGDFNTAPALSPFFCRTLARLVTELVDAALAHGRGAVGSGRFSVVELGGGEGQLAATILGSWEAERPELRGTVSYRILEVGPGLRVRQAEAVRALVARGWEVGWGATLEEACAGTRPVVMVGNEFMDTLPAHLVRATEEGLAEAHVRSTSMGDLRQTWGPVSESAETELQALFGPLDPARLAILSSDGFIELFPGMAALLRQVADAMPMGSLVNVDYGDWFSGVASCGELCGLGYRRLRKRTVRGYFKQQSVADILARPGRQDLTADVDFAALDFHGRREGFERVLFTTLSAFLTAGGAEQELETLAGADGESDVLECDRQATVLRNLLDDRDLGGTFKLMVQVRE